MRKPRVRSAQDLAAGLFFVAAGAAWIWVGRDYPMGTLTHMSSGFLPRALSVILVLLGIVTAVRGLTFDGPPIESWGWRPLLFVIGSIVLFGLLIDRLGLVVAGAALIVCGALATPQAKFRQLLLTIIVLIAGSVMVFVWGLGLQIPVWPRW